MLHKLFISSTFAMAATAFLALPAAAADRDADFFKTVEGEWSGPGEIVAGKYKGTKFICNFTGSTPANTAGMALDGSCRVGVFSQKMSASVERVGRDYKGKFLDGAAGKGLDVISGNVDDGRVVFGLNRKKLKGALLANLADPDNMKVTVSVRVNKELVPVIGMNLKRLDVSSTGSIARK